MAITQALNACGAGDVQAADQLLPLVYDQLRSLARSRMASEPRGQTLQATALVHEAYLRVVGTANPAWNSRGHFFAAAAQAMRRILVEQARRKARIRHGGEFKRQPLNDVTPEIEPPVENIIAVDEALSELEDVDSRKAAIVRLRYFAGLSVEDTAAVLERSVTSVERDWRFAKRWLYTRLTDAPRHDGADRNGG